MKMTRQLLSRTSRVSPMKRASMKRTRPSLSGQSMMTKSTLKENK